MPSSTTTRIKVEAERASVRTELVPANEAADIQPILASLGPDAGVVFNSDSFVLRNLKLAIDLSAQYRGACNLRYSGNGQRRGTGRIQSGSSRSLPAGGRLR